MCDETTTLSPRQARYQERLRAQEQEFRDVLERMAKLAERRRTLEQLVDQVRQDLEAEIRQARAARLSSRLICKAVGLSHQRISQIMNADRHGRDGGS